MAPPPTDQAEDEPALNLPQGAFFARGGPWRMEMGWEQLEQPGAAAATHQPHRVCLVRFSLPIPPYPMPNFSQKTAIWAGFAVVSAAHNLRTHVGDR